MPILRAATFSDSESDAMDQAALRLWQSEVNHINNGAWDSYANKLKSLHDSKVGHDSYLAAREKVHGFTYPANKHPGDGSSSIQQAIDAIKAAHYCALRMTLFKVTNPVNRAAMFNKIAANIDVDAPADASSFLAHLPDTTDQDFQDKIKEEISSFFQAADYFNSFAGGKIPPATVKAIAKYMASNRIQPIEMIDFANREAALMNRMEVLVTFGENYRNYRIPGLEEATKKFGYLLVGAAFALGIWHTIEERTDYAQNCIKTCIETAGSIFMVETGGMAISDAVEAATDSICASLEIVGTAAADCASVIAGLVTFGIGTVVGVALTSLLDFIVDLFWLGSRMPANMLVLMTAPMSANMRSGLLAEMTASMDS